MASVMWSDWWVHVPVEIVLTIVAALILRWLVRRVIDRGVRTVAETSLTRRLARASANHMGEDGARVVAERTSARARTVGSLLKSVTTFTILGIAGLIVLGLIGVDIAPLIASAGIVGIAVGFGAQSLIKDFLTGIFMIFEDQYGVGDVVDAGQALGTVEEVGLRITKLRDDNGVIWYIPNGAITRIGNKSQGWAVADVQVPVAPSEDLERVQALLVETAAAMAGDPDWDAVVLDEPPVVTVESITPEAVIIRVRLHTQPTRQGAVARELRVRVKTALDGAGVAYTKGPRNPH